MEETSVGLHIRFEGDTTPLQTSLKKAERTINDISTKLNKTKSALRFDPSSFKSLSSQAELASLKISAIYDKIGLIQNKAKNATFSYLATDATEASIRLTEADRRLELIKGKLKEIAAEQNVAWDKDNIKGVISQFENLNNEQAQVVAKYEEILAEHHKWNEIVNKSKANIDFTNYRSDMEKLEAEAKQLQETVITATQKMGESFQNVKGIDAADRKLESLDAQLEAAKQEAQELERAFEKDPKNLKLASQYSAALQEQQSLAVQHANALYEKINLIKSSGIKSTSDSAATLARRLVDAKNSFKDASDESNRLHARIVEINSAMQKLKDEGQKNTSEWKKLNSELAETKAKLEKADNSAEGFRQEIQKISSQQALKKLENDFDKTRNTVNATSQSVSKFRQGLSRINANLAGIRDLGTAFGAIVTPALMTGFYKVISASEEIDSAYRDMRKTVDGTEVQFQRLYDSAIKFSQTSIVSADQILEIEALGGQMGLAVTSLEKFAETVSNLDIATNMDSEDIAEQLGQMANIMSLTDDEFANFGDALVRLGNTMPTQESNIMEITSRIASMGTISGMTADQILGWSAAIASTGQNSEAAGTAMSNTMSAIENAVSGGGEALEKFAEVAGMTSDSFAELWNTNASAALQKFVEGLHQIDVNGGSMNATLTDLGITAVRQKQGLMGLAQSVDNVQLALGNAKSAWNDGGDAAEEASKKTAGFSGSLGILQNSASALAVQFGEGLVPFMDALSGILQAVTSIFSAMPAPVKSVTVAILGIVAALGPLTRIFAQAKISLADFSKSMSNADKATKLVKKNAETCKLSIQGVQKSVSGVATGMKTVPAQLKNTSSAMSTLSASCNKVKTSFSNLGKSLLKFAKDNAILLIISAITMIAGAVTGAINANAKLTRSFTAVSKAVKTAGTATKQYVATTDADKIADVAESHLALADSITESSNSLATSQYMVTTYTSQLVKLMDAAKNGTVDVGALRGAVSLFNNAVGTSYEVSQDASGQWVVMADNAVVSADEIYSAAKTYLKAAQLQAYADQLKEISAQKVEDAKNYAAAIDEVNQAYAIYQSTPTQENYNAWVAAKEKAEKYKKTLDDINEAEETVGEKINFISSDLEGTAKAIQELYGGMINVLDPGQIQEFADAWDEAGLSIQDMTILSETQLMQLAGKFKEGGKAIQEFADAIKNSEADANFEKIIGNITTSAETGNKKVSAIAAKIYSAAIKALPSQAKGNYLAAMFGEGIYSGLNSKLAKIRRIVNSLPKGVLNIIETVWDISSPSRAARKLGSYFTEGLYLGLKDNQKSIAQLTSDIAKDANASMSELMAPSFDTAATAAYAANNASSVSKVSYSINFNGTSINAEDAMSRNFINNMYELNRLAQMQGV